MSKKPVTFNVPVRKNKLNKLPTVTEDEDIDFFIVKINDYLYNMFNFNSFEDFVLQLELHGIDYKTLQEDNLVQFNIGLKHIDARNLKQLKQLNMTWKDYREYASMYLIKYAENVSDTPLQQFQKQELITDQIVIEEEI